MFLLVSNVIYDVNIYFCFKDGKLVHRTNKRRSIISVVKKGEIYMQRCLQMHFEVFTKI